MKPYVIKQGDYLTKLAHLGGFDADQVWNDSANAELREQRADPEMLKPGDVLQVPDVPPKRLKFEAQAENQYTAKVPTVDVTVTLDADGEPRAEEKVVVKGLGDEEEKLTDEAGQLTLTLPVTVREVELLLPDSGTSYRVTVGDLDPIDEPSGQRMRLTNLGYFAPSFAPEGYARKDDDQLGAALKAFQVASELEPTGELDDATRQALLDAHGS